MFVSSLEAPQSLANVRYELQRGDSGTYCWQIVSLGNRKVLASSEAYATRFDAVAAVNLVRNGSTGAELVDRT
ncbi:YegP family protein [Agromyces aerolatus]|uniref:YegP family protein n=1 Tax=Agromyces sp. LY-1074 TaxID=3074080 RepID=UPI00285667C8|nr:MULTISPECIES: DUF1508 domain-containing protein [unclassified Agromyces]MDR5698837.1 DUF1508 domain-containing protein [Agromyces sp. LY-1074]MDR5705385.1 DUF1508 domain-containing protein [Agromyces sp. LY-1358]